MKIYIFEDEVFYHLEDLQNYIEEIVYTRYPEIIHSDFDAVDSYEYDSLLEEVEEIELDIEKIKEIM